MFRDDAGNRAGRFRFRHNAERRPGLPHVQSVIRRAAHRRTKRFRFAVLLLAIALLPAAVGCAKEPAGSAPPSASAPPSGDPDASAFTFGIIYPIAHPFYETVTERAELAAAAAGGSLVVKAPDEANVEQQIRMLENMIRLRVDGIAISPVDSEALAPYIDQAAEAGIPVVCFESDAPSSARIAYIGGDNRRTGARMGEALRQLLRKGGMVLVESGISGMAGQQERLDGFLDYVREQPDIHVLEVRSSEGSDDRALAELERMIEDHPHFDAFVALDYVSGSSSVLAWKAMGLNRYSLTIGMMPAIGEAIVNGQITLAVTQNESSWGGRIVDALLKAMNGQPVPERIDTGESVADGGVLRP